MYLSELFERAGLSREGEPVDIRNWNRDAAEEKVEDEWPDSKPNVKPGVFAQPLLAGSAVTGSVVAALAMPCGARALLFSRGQGEASIRFLPIPMAWALGGLGGRLGCHAPPAEEYQPRALASIREYVLGSREGLLASAPLAVHTEDRVSPLLVGGREGYASSHILQTGPASAYWLHAQLEREWTLPVDLAKGLLAAKEHPRGNLWDWIGGGDPSHYTLADDKLLLHNDTKYVVVCSGAIRDTLLLMLAAVGKPGKRLLAYQLFAKGALLRFSCAKQARWMGWLSHHPRWQLSDAIFGCDSEQFDDAWLKSSISPAVEFEPGEGAALGMWLTLRGLAR